MSEAARIFDFDTHAERAVSTATVAAGVTIVTKRVRSMLNVRGNPDDAGFARAILGSFDVALPREPNTAVSAGVPGTGTRMTRALWLGPDEWLLVGEHAALEAPAHVGTGTITDVSHGRAVLRVSGPEVRAALAKGCSLDLHPRAFPPDRCAQTAIAKVAVILDHTEQDVFDLYCSRSYAGSFWHWLTQAAAEYGCNIARV